MIMSDLVEVYRGINGPQAHVVRNFLQNAGIPAVVDGDQLQNVLGELVVGWPTSPRVLVNAENAAWAKSLIAAVESNEDEPLPEMDGETDEDETE
jgi:hypothetical protein